jgi:hypothetical protein
LFQIGSCTFFLGLPLHCNPLTSAFLLAGITGMYHHTWLSFLFIEIEILTYLRSTSTFLPLNSRKNPYCFYTFSRFLFIYFVPVTLFLLVLCWSSSLDFKFAYTTYFSFISHGDKIFCRCLIFIEWTNKQINSCR